MSRRILAGGRSLFFDSVEESSSEPVASKEKEVQCAADETTFDSSGDSLTDLVPSEFEQCEAEQAKRSKREAKTKPPQYWGQNAWEPDPNSTVGDRVIKAAAGRTCTTCRYNASGVCIRHPEVEFLTGDPVACAQYEDDSGTDTSDCSSGC